MTVNDDERRSSILRELGIGPVWRSRADERAAPVPAAANAGPEEASGTPAAEAGSPERRAGAAGSAPSADEIGRMDWPSLKTAVAGCVKCDLCHGRTQTVFGTGNEKATWLFVGEGPGRNEDARGEPFIGQAGKLLDNMLASLGLQRGDNAYIANVVKCRPTDPGGKDRAPSGEEAAACLPYLRRQIELIQPAVIVALGKTAAVALLGIDADTPVSRLRGTRHRYQDLPLVVTYHPAYLLRNPADKKKVWADLCTAVAAHGGKA